MNVNRRVIFLSLLALIILSAGKNYFIHKSNSQFLVDTKLSLPDVQFHGFNPIQFFSKNKNEKFQTVFFNSLIPDTVVHNSNYSFTNPVEKNNSIIYVPSSAKQYAPIFEFPNALVTATRIINNEFETCSEWNYKTKINKPGVFPVVSLFINPDDFFGFYNGIYCNGVSQLLENHKPVFSSSWWFSSGNFQNRGKNWRRKIYFQFLSQNGTNVYGAYANVSISGNASRGFAQKSLKLRALGNKGKKNFKLSSLNANLNSIVLRNNGNDQSKMLFTDLFVQSCVSDSSLIKQDQISVEVFINGIYWGVYTLCSDINDYYIAKKLKLNKNKINLLEGDVCKGGDSAFCAEEISEIKSICKKKYSEPLFEKLLKKINLNSFCSFTALQIYSSNIDLYNGNVNWYNAGNKWKWIVKDLDCAYAYSGQQAVKRDMFENLKKVNGTYGLLFNFLIQSSEFKKLLKSKLTEMFSGSFKIENQLQQFKLLKNNFRLVVENQINRWRIPVSIKFWENQLNAFENFIKNRQTEVYLQINKYLMN